MTQLALPRVDNLPSRSALIAAGYLVAFVSLDWASYIYPLAKVDLTPWNPPVGLSFALVLLFGRRFLPLLLAGPLLAELFIRGWPLGTPIELAVAAIPALTYSCGLLYLTSPSSQFNASFENLRDLVLFVAVAVICAAIVSLGIVGLLGVTSTLHYSELPTAMLRLWIGDAIGIIVTAPLLLVISTGRYPRFRLLGDGLPMLAIIAAVAIVFSVPASSQLQLFYLLFLPIIWIGFHSGFERMTLALVVTQVALLAGLQYANERVATVTAFQLLLFVLAITGLFTGAVVSQHRFLVSRLRTKQEALARVARVGSMGALAAAIAHDINQPLSAIATYTDLVRQELAKPSPDTAVVTEAAEKAITQVNRAAEIVRRLRRLAHLGQSEVGIHSLPRVIKDVSSLLRDELERQHVRLISRLSADLPMVQIDRIQIEQVIVNLVRNSVDAMQHMPAGEREISIDGVSTPLGFVTINVRDRGPGIPSTVLNNAVAPLSSTKPGGLGLGLIISRTIVETHGGKLWIDRNGPGGVICFTLKAHHD